MNNRISRLLNLSYETVPYYNNVFNKIGLNSFCDITYDQFKKIPVINKETIKTYGIKNFIDNNYLDDDNNLIESNSIHYEHTSGTTGEQMQILWKENEYFFSTMEHWKKRFEIANILPNSKCCCVCYDDPRFYKVSQNKFEINRRLLTYNSAIRYLKHCIDFSPEWIYMPSSVLAYLVFVAQREKIAFNQTNVRYIELATEPVLPYYRNIIEKYFNLKSYNMYGCQETNGIAFECERGNMHIMEDNVFLEIIDENNFSCGKKTWGNICVTGYYNTLFPIIRYKLNDIGMITDMKCECGNNGRVLHFESCRFPEILLLNNEKIFYGWNVFYPLRRFSYVETNDGVLFYLKFISAKKYKITFLNVNTSEMKRYSSLMNGILKSYCINDTDITFDCSNELIDTYKVGVLKKCI